LQMNLTLSFSHQVLTERAFKNMFKQYTRQASACTLNMVGFFISGGIYGV